MALDPGSQRRSISPASSEGSSAFTSRTRARDEEVLLKKDKSYRRFAAGVDRALSLFDTTLQEWADYISFLSRLLKALQAHPPNLAAIPSKALVSKRLAQCMNPSLPSGVHQKALEVYSCVFSILKQDGLSRDLQIYLPGISSTLTFASLSVRPIFLSLVESHLLNIDPLAIRPALRAIILALLPGLEEETSEDFERTLKILDKFKTASGQVGSYSSGQETIDSSQFFWQCLFLASITNPSRRLGVLAYLNRYLPRLGGPDDTREAADAQSDSSATSTSQTAAIVSPEPGLLIRCFATGLSDEQTLVQRAFLDLLVTHVPLHSPIFSQAVSVNDKELLVTTAMGVVLRRDMSLNRRLWTWFLGPETIPHSASYSKSSSRSSPAEGGPHLNGSNVESSKSQYFGKFGLKPLVSSLQSMISRNPTSPSERARPFRIALSLMDRWEVGGLVVPEVFLPILKSVQQYESIAQSKQQFVEVLRSANVLFDGVESGLIWSELLTLLTLDPHDPGLTADSVLADLELVKFVISNFNVREEEMLVIHVPLIALSLLSMVNGLTTSANEDSKPSWFSPKVKSRSINLIIDLIELTSDRAFLADHSSSKSIVLGGQNHQWTIRKDEVIKNIRYYYAQCRENPEFTNLPFCGADVGDLLTREGSALIAAEVSSDVPSSSLREGVHLLEALIIKVPHSRTLYDGKLYTAIYDRILQTDEPSRRLPFPATSSMISAIVALYSSRVSEQYISYQQLYDAAPLLVKQLWPYLSPTLPRYHVEAARCLWQLQSILWEEQVIEASITRLMVESRPSDTSHLIGRLSAERFAIIWNHSGHANRDFYDGARLPLPGRHSEQRGVLPNVPGFSSMLHRPLFLMLDLLSHEACEAYPVVREWIQTAPSMSRIMQIVISRMVALNYLGSRLDVKPELREDGTAVIISEDAEECQYCLHTMFNLLSAMPENGWSEMITELIPSISVPGTMNRTEAEDSGMISIQLFLLQLCQVILETQDRADNFGNTSAQSLLLRTTLSVMQQLLSGLHADRLVDTKAELFLIDRLMSSACQGDQFVREALVDTLLAALKLYFTSKTSQEPIAIPKHRRLGSRDTVVSSVRLSVSTERVEKDQLSLNRPSPPPRLFECLLMGLSAPSSRPVLDRWITVLMECFPLYSDTIFQILLPLVECFVREIESSFHELQAIFRGSEESLQGNAERSSISLLNGFEFVLAKSHDRLMTDEARVSSVKSPEQAPGFFGNMVSGVFASEANQARGMTANNRLTVLLCFQDAVRTCFLIWSWGSIARSEGPRNTDSLGSFQYTSLRLRNRTRRMLEHIFAAEALECLETLVDIWGKSLSSDANWETSAVFDLLHTLDGSRPKVTIPAIFNAIYSRTNPTALEPNRKSTLASNLSDSDLVNFLVTYARTLEDDVLEEIWMDCTMFLRDVLANPFPHRQILPRLVEFTAVLGEKVENTNFGEERRMRRDLGELFGRLLTAIFTIKPTGFSQDSNVRAEASTNENKDASPGSPSQLPLGPDDVTSVLARTVPIFSSLLGDSDRISVTMGNISTHITGPLIHSRSFPENMPDSALELLYQMAKIPAASKSWRKDVADAFNEGKFFRSSLHQVKTRWLGLLRQLALAEKDRLPDLYSRLTTPTSAGIMFGVGAGAARLEADRRTQANLRRIAVMVLSSEQDTFAGNLVGLREKLEDLVTATAISSPSSSTRAEIFMLLRSLILKTSSIHLAPFWPLINSELHAAISAAFPDEREETYNWWSILQACKLLDTLLLLAPDEFQLHEWLFVTDTIDAVYRPNHWEPVALADQVSHGLGQKHMATATPHLSATAEATTGKRRPLLVSGNSRNLPKEEVVSKVLRPFFDQLSIYAFESTYGMGVPDREACLDDLLADLFTEETVPGP